MKYFRIILRILAFTLGLAVLFTVTSLVFSPKSNSPSSGMEEVSANGILGEKENTIDALIIGDSESYSSISPLHIWGQTGYTSYVCGSAGQTLDYSETLLSRALETQNPKYVFLETDAIYRDLSAQNVMLSSLTGQFDVFRYHNRWKTLSLSDFVQQINFSWTDKYKGFILNNTSVPSKAVNHMKRTNAIQQISAINSQYVERIKSICDENGIKLVLLSTPSTVNWNYERHNGVQQLADDLGCEYIDLNLKNNTLKIDWETDTRDAGDHLNYKGAVKVSDYLAEYLKSSRKLSDHRGDKLYELWAEANKAYETEVSKITA